MPHTHKSSSRKASDRPSGSTPKPPTSGGKNPSHGTSGRPEGSSASKKRTGHQRSPAMMLEPELLERCRRREAKTPAEILEISRGIEATFRREKAEAKKREEEWEREVACNIAREDEKRKREKGRKKVEEWKREDARIKAESRRRRESRKREEAQTSSSSVFEPTGLEILLGKPEPTQTPRPKKAPRPNNEGQRRSKPVIRVHDTPDARGVEKKESGWERFFRCMCCMG